MYSISLILKCFNLKFWVHEEHYENGKLQVSCKAEIVDVYVRETETYLVGEHTVGTDKALQAISKASNAKLSSKSKHFQASNI